MPEVAPTGENHRHIMFVGGIYDLLVADRPAGLDDRSCTGFGNRIYTIAEWKEGVRSGD